VLGLRVPDFSGKHEIGVGVSAMEVAEFIEICARVYHTTSALAWPSLQRHGLLSTVRLVDLFDVEAIRRSEHLLRLTASRRSWGRFPIHV
jgi:hypothetical protein